MSEMIPFPPYDPELLAGHEAPLQPLYTQSDFDAWRAQGGGTLELLQPLLAERGLVYHELEVPVLENLLTISVVKPATVSNPMPALFNIHGGGMIFGSRFEAFLPETLDWATEHELVIFSPEYTLAPEAQAPRAALECFAALKWVFENDVELGIDPQRVILSGVSGGGGIAASVGLLARDNGGPRILSQLLICPQLGDRHDTVSSRQFSVENGAHDSWPSETNRFAWDAILGKGHEDRDVSIYASPARADDLGGLPPTFIDAGGNEVFRDADVDFASRLWESGVNAELHIWPGGYHGFDVIVPSSPISISAKRARSEWITRALSGELV